MKITHQILTPYGPPFLSSKMSENHRRWEGGSSKCRSTSSWSIYVGFVVKTKESSKTSFQIRSESSLEYFSCDFPDLFLRSKVQQGDKKTPCCGTPKANLTEKLARTSQRFRTFCESASKANSLFRFQKMLNRLVRKSLRRLTDIIPFPRMIRE